MYFVLEGTARIRAGADSLTITKYGAVLVARRTFLDKRSMTPAMRYCG
jgi:hypothetical protein